MFGFTKDKKKNQEEPTKISPDFSPKEKSLIMTAQNDFECSRASRMGDYMLDVGTSKEEEWEDEYRIYTGGGLQWTTNMAYRSLKARKIRPNSEDNLVFNAINTLHANITATVPEKSIDCNYGGDEETIEEKLTDALRFNDKRNGFAKTWRKLVYDFIGAGPTIAMITWDQDWQGGRGPERWVGDVKVERVDKWDMYFDPSIHDLETDIQCCRFIVREIRKGLMSVKDRWENGKYLDAEMTNDELINEGSDPQSAYIYEYWHKGYPMFMPEEIKKELEAKALQLQEEGDEFKAREYLDASKGDLQGVHVAYVSQGILLEYRPYEYEDGLYPFVYTARYTDEKHQHGFGEIRNIKIPQIMHNKADEVEMEAMCTEGLGNWWYQKGALNKKQLNRVIENGGRGGQMFDVDNLNGIEPKSGPKVPPSIAAYKDHKQTMIDTVSQVSPTMQGLQQGSNVPARAIMELGSRSDIRIKQANEKLECFIKDITMFQIGRFAQFYTEERYYRIKDSNGKEKEGRITSTELHKDWIREEETVISVDEFGNQYEEVVEKKERFLPSFDVKVTIMSEKPTDRSYYTTLGFDLYNMQLLTPEDLFAVLEDGKMPPMKDLLEHLYAQNGMMDITAQIQELPKELQEMATQLQQQAFAQFMQQIQMMQSMQSQNQSQNKA